MSRTKVMSDIQGDLKPVFWAMNYKKYNDQKLQIRIIPILVLDVVFNHVNLNFTINLSI